jgi:hypothetical protein
MAFNQSEKNEIEKIVKKEVKGFFESNTLKQFEEKIIELLVKDIKKGKSEKEIKNIISKTMLDFYEYLWNNRSVWSDKIKR